MSFIDLTLKNSYETKYDNPLEEFYIPVLNETISYDRIAGYFSATSLVVASRGIAGLIRNGGKMRIIASPNFSKDELEILIKTANDVPETVLMSSFEMAYQFEDEYSKDHLKALGWMLSNKLLEIKLAIVLNDDENAKDALFHQKIGLLTDLVGNRLSFSGSINETASGWIHNSEEFKVFRGWLDSQNDYLVTDEQRFNDIWNGFRSNIKIYDLPDGIKNQIITYSQDFNKDIFLSKKYVAKSKETIEEKLNLFYYQNEAKNKWISNNYNLLFEMATGTGKTRTAITCIYEATKIEESLVVVISCPQTTLSKQWKKEIDKIGLVFDEVILADGNHKWRASLESVINKIKVGYFKRIIIYTTHTTSSNKDFILYMESLSDSTKLFFIGDEAHGLGAVKTKKALQKFYSYRIGLSATPKRWFDDYGTKILEDYFGNNSYQFTIADALREINPITGKHFLVDYYYNPIFVKLSDDEFEEYLKLTNKIKKLSFYSKNSDKYQEQLEKLIFARADITKNAENKYGALNNLLKQFNYINNTIIFTSPEQLNVVMHILNDKNIISHRFTEKEGTKPELRFEGLSEREYLIKKFKDNSYNALVAIKCLDEGIDIPSANTAIIMANSTNPREYIQRIGRVIRQSENKKEAYIYDFIIEPDFNRITDQDVLEFEKMVFNKEIIRAKDMAFNAINNATVYVELSKRVGDYFGNK